MIVGRMIGWLLWLIGIGVLGLEGVRYIDTDYWSFIPLATGLVEANLLEPVAFAHLQTGLERHVAPFLWSDIVQPVLLWPVWGWALGLGTILLILFRAPRSAA